MNADDTKPFTYAEALIFNDKLKFNFKSKIFPKFKKSINHNDGVCNSIQFDYQLIKHIVLHKF